MHGQRKHARKDAQPIGGPPKSNEATTRCDYVKILSEAEQDEKASTLVLFTTLSHLIASHRIASHRTHQKHILLKRGGGRKKK